jgi:tRNA dimethylallyltransferase
MVHARPVITSEGVAGTARLALMLMGPTASGKTEAAISVAEQFPVEIISVDSSLVYRGMDIGTAKPAPETMARFPHHLVDIREPWQTYSAAEFRADALRLMDEILRRGRLPLLVGGTMFYFRSLECGFSELPPSDRALRRRIEDSARKRGWPALHAELARLDPKRAAQIAPRDKQRIQRALEIVQLTGGPLEVRPRRPRPGEFRFIKIGLAPCDRAVLHRRIASRFEAMLALGLVEEVEKLLARREVSPELPAMKMVGYRQVAEFLRHEVGYNAMVQNALAATRQLAKRQLTWLRNQGGITWVDTGPSVRQSVLNAYILSKLAPLGV